MHNPQILESVVVSAVLLLSAVGLSFAKVALKRLSIRLSLRHRRNL